MVTGCSSRLRLSHSNSGPRRNRKLFFRCPACGFEFVAWQPLNHLWRSDRLPAKLHAEADELSVSGEVPVGVVVVGEVVVVMVDEVFGDGIAPCAVVAFEELALIDRECRDAYSRER